MNKTQINKWFDQSDIGFVSKFLQQYSNLTRRQMELEKLRRQRENYLNWIIISIFIVVYGILYNIFGHGNGALSFIANVQQNLQPQNFFATLHPLIYFYLFFFAAFVVRFKYIDFQIKALLLYDKTQPKS